MVSEGAWAWGTPFIEPEGLNNSQLTFVTIIYAIVLYQSSNLISNGSEFLLLVPSVAGLVGSIVLPILGAVPDGMMTLCSGLGPDAQSQVSAGVGVLAGSTVMLLTFPWFIAVVFGRVPLKDGVADYGNKAPVSAMEGGVTYKEAIPKNAKIMICTTLLYFIIQIPATMQEQNGATTLEQSKVESTFALIGLVASVLGFVVYLKICFDDSKGEDIGHQELEMIISCINNRTISLSGALVSVAAPEASGMSAPLKFEDKRLRKILRPFFSRYDADKSDTLEKKEFECLLRDLGEPIDDDSVTAAFKRASGDNAPSINFAEFVECVMTYLNDDKKAETIKKAGEEQAKKGDENGDDEEEEDEIPDDLVGLEPAEQQKRIILRASWMMFLGTFLVLIFSDPLVDCLDEWGTRLDISPFYVAFVVAPFASNASELLSAYNYAVKKSSSGITTALSTLLGAACMNNTFVLAIFFALIYFKELAWQFTAETIAIVVVQWAIGLVAILKTTHTPAIAIMILLCYPACLMIVNVLENSFGID